MQDQFREESVRAVMPETRPAAAVEPATSRLREQIAKNTTQSPLEAFKSVVEGMDILDRDSSRAIIEENIGTKVDSRGNKVLTTEQAALKTKAEEYEETAEILLENGYDSPEFVSHQDDLRATAEGILMAIPEMAAIMPTDPGEKKDFLDVYLKDPRLMAIVRRRYAEAHSDSRTIPDSVTPAAIDFEAAKKADAELDKKIKEAKAKIATLAQVLDRFKSGGADDLELTRLSKTYSQDTTKLRGAELQTTRIDESIGRLNLLKLQREDQGEPTGDLEAKILALQTLRDKLETETIMPMQANIQERDRLANLKTTSEQDLRTEQENLEEHEGQKPDFARDKAIKQAALEQAQRKRITEERKYVRSLDILPAAIIEFQTDRLREAEKARIEDAKKQEQDTADRAEKALARQRQKRWTEPKAPTRFNSDTTKPNKAKIEQDLALGLSLDVGKGPDALIQDMLVKGLADEVAAGNMTQEQVDAYVREKMQDKDFLAKARADTMRDLLAVRFRSGGKISRSEAALIAESPWGKDVVDNALNKKDELRQVFERAKEQGVIKGDIASAIKDNPNLLYILLAIAAGTVAVAVGAPLIAAGVAGAAGGKALR